MGKGVKVALLLHGLAALPVWGHASRQLFIDADAVKSPHATWFATMPQAQSIPEPKHGAAMESNKHAKLKVEAAFWMEGIGGMRLTSPKQDTDPPGYLQ